MMLSDDKISHLSHVLLKGLLERKLVTLIEDEGKVRAEIKKTVVSELKIGAEIDAAVRKNFNLFRKIVEEVPSGRYFTENSSGKRR
jgi:hypothetical protein